jgi:hypothetical protein
LEASDKQDEEITSTGCNGAKFYAAARGGERVDNIDEFTTRMTANVASVVRNAQRLWAELFSDDDLGNPRFVRRKAEDYDEFVITLHKWNKADDAELGGLGLF